MADEASGTRCRLASSLPPRRRAPARKPAIVGASRAVAGPEKSSTGHIPRLGATTSNWADSIGLGARPASDQRQDGPPGQPAASRPGDNSPTRAPAAPSGQAVPARAKRDHRHAGLDAMTRPGY